VRGQYRTIPRAAQTTVVEDFGELKRLFDAVWNMMERGTWMKP